MKTKETMKKYLCKEEDEEFYIKANSLQAAQEICAIWNAIVIKEVDEQPFARLNFLDPA